ncbi:MAG: hypothetical protein CME68_09355, partial [Halobacteriovoraceae bacterium]|nr:hypothetical protein [Halobacteriovoraceae bacterium]
MYLIKIYLLILIFFNTHAFSQETEGMTLKSDQKNFDLDGRSLEVFQDLSGNLELEDILKGKNKFKKGTNKVLGYGFSKASTWIKLKIKNESTIK